MSVHLVLDIDNVLSFSAFKDPRQISFFEEEGTVIKIKGIVPQCVFPGVPQFIEVLRREGVLFSFFSSGKKERNVPYVKQLLDGIWPGEEHKEFKAAVRVFSSDHLVPTTKQEVLYRKTTYGWPARSCYKELMQVVKEGCPSIENTIIADDNRGVINSKQVKNCLWVPPAKCWMNVHSLFYKKFYYDEDGFTFQACFVLDQNTPDFDDRKWIQGRQRIIIIKTDKGLEIDFLNHEFQYETRHISKEDPNVLIQKLQRQSNGRIQDPELEREVCNLVISFGGMGKKICRQANRIYYIAGLFFLALEESKRKEIPISTSLFSLQFQKQEQRNYSFYKQNNCLKKNEFFYHVGLQKLREIKPDLQFTTPHNYAKIMNCPRFEEEGLFLERIFESQFI